MVPFKLTNKVPTDTGPSLISAQSVPRPIVFMDNRNNTRIVTPTLPPNQHRGISGASTALPWSPESKNTGKYIWNRVKLKNSPFPRYRHSSSFIVTNDNRIFVTGGLHDQSVYGDVWQIAANADGTSFTSKRIDIDQNTPPQGWDMPLLYAVMPMLCLVATHTSWIRTDCWMMIFIFSILILISGPYHNLSAVGRWAGTAIKFL